MPHIIDFDPQVFARDAQLAMSFLEPQFYRIEAEVAAMEYPEFNFEQYIPIDDNYDEWAQGTMFYSSDVAGTAKFISGKAFDIPMADVSRDFGMHGFHMAGIGYEWTMEEIAIAARTGRNLPNEKAAAASEIAQRFQHGAAMTGASEKGMVGMLNNPAVTATTVPANGTAGSTYWAAKTPEQVADDINNAITSIFTNTRQTAIADTVLLPTLAWSSLSTRRMTDSDFTIMNWLSTNNAFTAQTGRPLTIRGLWELNTQGAGGTGRMVVYRRDPRVLRFHRPMQHRFLPPFQVKSMLWEVAGIMRIGGTEIRRPKEIAYWDGITAP